MKNKYEMFNDTKIDENNYKNINISEEDKESIKNRMNKKIRYRKSNYKKNILVASIPILVAGGIALSGETSMAYIQNIGKQIEHFFNKNDDGKADIENFDLLKDLDLSKNYDVEVIIDEIGYTFNKDKKVTNDIRIGAHGGGTSEDGEPYGTKTGYLNGNWNFKTNLNGKELSKSIKSYDVNKSLDINYKGMDIKANIDELRVTPTRIKIKYNFEVENNTTSLYKNPIFLDFIIKDESGNKIQSNGGSYDLSSDKENLEGSTIEFEINKDMKEIKIVPVIEDWNKKVGKSTQFKNQTISLELNK